MPQLYPQKTPKPSLLTGMKAITVYPVWAWAIVHGHKRVENRTWRTHHRGPMLIHASAPSSDARRSDAAARAALSFLGVEVPDSVPTAAIVGLVELADVVAYEDLGEKGADPLATGPQCWILRGALAFKSPIPARGRQQLWTFSVDDQNALNGSQEH